MNGLLLLMLTWPQAAAGSEIAEILTDCESARVTESDSRKAWRCFYEAGRAHGAWSEVRLALEPHSAEPWAKLMLGHIAHDLSEPEASDLYGEAIAGFRASDDPRGEIYAQVASAGLHRRDSAFPEAMQRLAAAEDLTDAVLDDPYVSPWVLVNQGRVLRMMGLYEEAREAVEAAADEAFPDGPYQVRLLTLYVLAGLYLDVGELGRSFSAGNRTVEMTLEAGDKYAAVFAMGRLLELYQDDPQRVAARGGELVELGRQMLAMSLESGNVHGEIQATCHLGWLLGSAGREHTERCVSLAIEHYDNPLPMKQSRIALTWFDEDPERALAENSAALELNGGDPDTSAPIRFRQAWMLWESGRRTEAIAESLRAIEDVEDARDQSFWGDLGLARYYSYWHPAYHHLAARIALDPSPDLDLALTTMERLRGRAWTEQRVRRAWSPTAEPGTAGHIEQMRLGADRQEPRASSLAAVQASLEDDEALVVYQAATTDASVWFAHRDFAIPAWALLITAGSAEAIRLSENATDEPRIDAFLGLLSRDDAVLAQATQALRRDLVAPVEAALPEQIRRLSWVPDGALHRLPLGLLLPDRFEALDRVPSVEAWMTLRERTPPPLREVLALGDPSFTAYGHPMAARLAGLPAARWEAERAGGRVLIGSEATEAAVASFPDPPPGLIHLAAHAVVDDDRPWSSALLLAPGSGHDGVLRAAEIGVLPLDRQVVALSACSSASGTVLRSEGVVGIAQAFLDAGAQTVVANLWPLQDGEAADFTDRLYGQLEAGSTVAEAVRHVQRTSEAPPAWAGVVVVGDGRARPFPEGRAGLPVRWLMIGALLLFASLGVLGVLRESTGRRSR